METVYALIRNCLKKHGIKEPPILGNIDPLNKWLIGQPNILRNTLHIFSACSTLSRGQSILSGSQWSLEFEATQHGVPEPRHQITGAGSIGIMQLTVSGPRIF